MGPFGGGMVGAGVGPFAQAGLDEALGLAVGARRIGSGADMAQPGLAAGGAKVVASISRTVVGHDSLDGDAVAGEPAERPVEEGDGARLLLVGQDLGVGEPRGIVDAGMQHVIPDAAVAVDPGMVAGDAVADAVDAAKLF